VRIPAFPSLLVIAVLALGPTASASAAAPVVAPEFADSFPALVPLEATAEDTTASSALGPDERVLLAATFWLLLAGLALWRARRQPEQDPTPVTGWVLGYAPPLPR
jgi:hypothetical protein